MTTYVLDHGFVRLVDVMGDDAAIVEAARTSYQNGTKLKRSDEGLIRYLMRNWHTSPFEMCELKFHVKCPIFVARQWLRHRTASVNEVSGRYSVLPDEFYIPDGEQVLAQSKSNKQGREGELPYETVTGFMFGLTNLSDDAFQFYKEALEEDVARETARIGLPLNTYTEFYWKIDLHNLLHFLRLRMDHHAQWEIQEYARAIGKMVESRFPVTYRAFLDYRLNSVTVSDQVRKALRIVLRHHGDLFEAAMDSQGVGEREKREIMEAFVI